MSQQHAQFEETFHSDEPAYQGGYSGPQPTPTYHSDYPSPQYTTSVPPAPSYIQVPGQKLLVSDLSVSRAPGVGARLALAIISLLIIFIMFLVTLGIVAANIDGAGSLKALAVFFAIVFAVIVLIINVIFNRKR